MWVMHTAAHPNNLNLTIQPENIGLIADLGEVQGDEKRAIPSQETLKAGAVGRAFLSRESGAVTTDFVVITAAVVGLGFAVSTTVVVGSLDLADQTTSAMEKIPGSDDDAVWVQAGGSAKKEDRAKKEKNGKKTKKPKRAENNRPKTKVK